MLKLLTAALSAMCALATAACSVSTAGEAQPAADAGTFLRFADGSAPGGVLEAPPKLFVSVGGRPMKAVMDTGSTGLLLAARDLPEWRSLPSLGRARLTYSSSGRIMEGAWVLAPVTIAGADGSSVTTDPMPVMVVTRIACFRSARNCTPEERPRHVAMLGVGFGRMGDHQAQSTPDHNPFLRVGGAARRGYVVTQDGVTVGLGTRDRYAGFQTVRLHREAGAPDWSAAPVCLGIAGHLPPACGTVLVDTGVARSYLTVPTSQLEGAVDAGGGRPVLRPGTDVAVDLSGEGRASPGYVFRAGDASDPAAPEAVTLVRPGERPTFINTSVRFLNRFDYMYDADDGLVGYRKRG